ncbi:uncharacterized protein LOC129988956 [Argiope bruennichi]|uniref:Uncharacterized protein n=1 Tax=Argiope bruennichi TaxID=94029 RepID=A0A8T0EEQ2_ARGBR|nr:uncharacterized protein LOC129988956 [Argiope bruennichi]KAF8771130.1 hypothetical protein HNY73_018583 [Argiope bruennichi]
MNSVVSFLCIAVALCAASVAAGPVLPYRLPLAGVRSYYYGGVPAPVVAPYGAVAPVAAAPAVVPDYYTYSAAAALSYPGYPYAGYYGVPYGAYAYPYYKK